MLRNSPKWWSDEVCKRGVQEVLYGADITMDEYNASGREDWARIKSRLDRLAPHLWRVDHACLDRVLEWGAGDGRVLVAAADDGGQVVGYEPAEHIRWLLRARMRGRPTTLIPPLAYGYPEELKFLRGDSGFDLVYSVNVVDHLSYDDLCEFFMFAEAAVKPTGVLWFDYMSEDCRGTASALANRPDLRWPSYYYHSDQIAMLMAGLAPSLHLVESAIEADRHLEVYVR